MMGDVGGNCRPGRQAVHRTNSCEGGARKRRVCQGVKFTRTGVHPTNTNTLPRSHLQTQGISTHTDAHRWTQTRARTRAHTHTHTHTQDTHKTHIPGQAPVPAQQQAACCAGRRQPAAAAATARLRPRGGRPVAVGGVRSLRPDKLLHVLHAFLLLLVVLMLSAACHLRVHRCCVCVCVWGGGSG
jgi:hypothetical protein